MKVSAERMKEARRGSGKSQEQVAEEMTARLGRAAPVHFTTISRWENGHLQPELDSLVAYAGVCGVGDFRALLEDSGPGGVAEFGDLMQDLAALLRAAADAAVREAQEKAAA